MAKKPRPEGKKYNYMDTYGDLVTLLLCFFVLLFSMSTVEEAKYNAFVEALNMRFSRAPTNLSFNQDSSVIEDASDFGDDQPTGMEMEADESMPADLSQLEQSIQEYVAENNMQGEVSVERSESGATFIRMSNNLLFDGDSFTLRPETREFLTFLADSFNAVESQILNVQFNAHTASLQDSSVDDWDLSGRRAGAVSSFIANDGGFNRFKIRPSSFGRNYPIADNTTPEGRARNRRVDIIVLSNEASTMQLTLMDAMRVYFPSDDVSFFEGTGQDLPDEFMQDVDPIGNAADLLAGLSEDELDAALNGADDAGTEAPADTGTGGPEQPADTGPADPDAPAFAGGQ